MATSEICQDIYSITETWLKVTPADVEKINALEQFTLFINLLSSWS